MTSSILWHDYETFGADPKRDRPSQFAAVRTDLDLNLIDEPRIWYCKPTDDYLPHPEACLITGITPQKAASEGLCEAEFIAAILEEMSVPGTCVAGYNSIRFDDEVTRFTLFRNLHDPYAREWRNGNSRWDIIDMVRMTYALRPDGVIWPRREDGAPSFRLEELTQANGIVHEAAHDAMSDVYATIALAKLIRDTHPKLYDYVFTNRDKHSVRKLFDIEGRKPVFHVSSKYPASQGSCALVAPICQHPANPNGIVVFDLRADPAPLAELNAAEIGERLFTAAADLPEGVDRIPLKTIHVNKCPAVAPSALLSSVPKERLLEFDLEGKVLRENLQKLREITGLEEKLAEVFGQGTEQEDQDPEVSLYSGPFFSNQDKKEMQRIHATTEDGLASLVPQFEDPRLPRLFARYKARNYSASLTSEEQAQWEKYRQQRLASGGEGRLSFDQFFTRIQALANEGRNEGDMAILEELYLYGQSLLPYDQG